MKNFMVYDIGGSSVKWSVIEEAGKILISGKIKIAENITGFFKSLADVCNEMKDKYELSGIAISAPGAVDSETGIIGGMSAIPYIHGPKFKDELKELTGLNVEIENDANCAALARNVAKLKGLDEGSIDGMGVFDLCSKGDEIAAKEVTK